jgi:flagellar hook-length control protein FliK
LYRRTLDLGADNAYNVFNPDLRDASILNGLNTILMHIEDVTELSRGTLSEVTYAEARTATEIKILKQRSFSANQDIQKELQDTLEEAIEAPKNDVVTENVTPAANTNTEEVKEFDQGVKDFTAKEVVSDDNEVVTVTTNQTNDTSDDAGESLADSKNQNQSLTFTKNDKHESVKDNSVHNEAQANTFNANVNNLNPQEVSVAPLGDNIQSLSSTQLDVINQINEYMKTQIKADMSTLEMQLNPANLGAVNVALSSKDGNVTAQFTTQSELVKAALESQIMILKENLEQAGVKVNAVEVSVESHAFERNLDEQGQNSGQEAKEEEEKRLRKATRRLNINDLFADDNSVELSEEESLTAEMMQADGNVMDYKA